MNIQIKNNNKLPNIQKQDETMNQQFKDKIQISIKYTYTFQFNFTNKK